MLLAGLRRFIRIFLLNINSASAINSEIYKKLNSQICLPRGSSLAEILTPEFIRKLPSDFQLRCVLASVQSKPNNMLNISAQGIFGWECLILR